MPEEKDPKELEENPEENPLEIPEEEPVEEIEAPEEELPRPDYEEKFKHSANENRVLREQNQVLKQRIAQVEVADPTVEQLKVEYPEWDEMTATEQKLAKKTYIADRRAEEVQKVVAEVQGDAEWNGQLDKFVEEAEAKDQYPEIVENREEFIRFATKRTHRGVPIGILADAFLTRVGKTMPEPKRTNLMSRGGGTQPPTPKKETLTAEQIKTLRKTDYKKYSELVRSGVIGKAVLETE